jgi:hypothetical protein
METEFTKFSGLESPVPGETIVELKLSNGHQPIDKANVFYWGP